MKESKVFLYVPEKDAILAFEMGTGDNLLDEDIEAGYDAYLNWSSIKLGGSAPIDLDDGPDDGGMCLFNSAEDAYDDDLIAAIPAVLAEAFDDANLKYVILATKDVEAA